MRKKKQNLAPVIDKDLNTNKLKNWVLACARMTYRGVNALLEKSISLSSAHYLTPTIVKSLAVLALTFNNTAQACQDANEKDEIVTHVISTDEPDGAPLPSNIMRYLEQSGLASNAFDVHQITKIYQTLLDDDTPITRYDSLNGVIYRQGRQFAKKSQSWYYAPKQRPFNANPLPSYCVGYHSSAREPFHELHYLFLEHLYEVQEQKRNGTYPGSDQPKSGSVKALIEQFEKKKNTDDE